MTAVSTGAARLNTLRIILNDRLQSVVMGPLIIVVPGHPRNAFWDVRFQGQISLSHFNYFKIEPFIKLHQDQMPSFT